MSDGDTSSAQPMAYGLEDRPPPTRAALLAAQHLLTMFGATVSVPLLLGPAMGMSHAEVGQLICCVMLCSGIATILQTTIGSRLPIVQGTSFSFLGVFLAIIDYGRGEDLSPSQIMQYISGAIIGGAIFELVAGYSGLIGRLRRWVSPVVIGPVIILIGLSLFKHGAPKAAQSLPIGGLTIVLVLVFTLLLARRVAMIGLFPIISSVAIVVTLCWALSIAGVFTGPGMDEAGAPVAAHPAYVNLSAAAEAPWVRADPRQLLFPWGTPKFAIGFIVAALAAYLASMLESFGDYHVCSYLARAGEPTDQQISRGIGAEGLGCAITGVFGGFASTSYSENIGVIGLTRVASRRVVQIAGVMLIVLGVVGKFGALAAAIPGPVVGGLYCTLFGMICAVGVQQLARADLHDNRNLLIAGFSLFMGLSVPAYLDGSTAALYPPGPQPLLDSLPQWLSQMIQSVGTTAMAVAAITGLILDNLVPGRERGKD